MADTSDLKRLEFDLGREGGRIGREAATAVRRSAESVQRAGKAAAPLGPTGVLRGSITVQYLRSGGAGSMVAIVGPEAYYGRFVEYGTVSMAPRPFMGPAAEAEAPKLEAAITRIAGEVLS